MQRQRTSSQNDLTAEFLGDCVYTAATRSGAVGMWNNVRNGADRPVHRRLAARSRNDQFAACAWAACAIRP